VICYESRKLKEHERHYATHDLELTTIVHALKMWRHYLMGKIFKLRTNHSGMKYLFGQPTLNAKQIRWLDKVDNAINMRVHEIHAIVISM
jgi:hypothetical protein